MTREQLSALLAEELAKRGWTVVDLARHAEMNYETVRSIVRGKTSASLENVDELLRSIDFELQAVQTPPSAPVVQVLELPCQSTPTPR